MRVYLSQFDGRTTRETLPLAAGVLAAASRADASLSERLDPQIDSERIDPDLAAAS